MSLNDHYRQIGRAWDALAEADDATRVARILDVAERLEDLAASGENDPDSDKQAATVLRLIADADLVATGQLSRRAMSDTGLEALLGPVLARMASEPDITIRAMWLEGLWRAIPDDSVAETVACMPYAPGMVGLRVEERMPSERSLRGFVKAVGVAWRARRAA